MAKLVVEHSQDGISISAIVQPESLSGKTVPSESLRHSGWHEVEGNS